MTLPRWSLAPAFALIALFAYHVPAQPPPAVSGIRVASGVTETGEATAQWLAILRKRSSEAQYDAAAAIRKPLTTSEAAWAALIRSRAGSWEQMIPELSAPYAPVRAPRSIDIVLGNRGGDDAFTHDAMTIGFDLSSLQAIYGDAALSENPGRMDSFFRHEFNHLLQKAWLVEHPWPVESPLQAALFDMWTEGLGNYFSLSAKWSSQRGERSPTTARTLAELEPRFVARLAALACAGPAAGPPLLKGLSSGKFEQKWGAVPPALWLKEEPLTDFEALRRFVVAGPDGVWDLAERHLPEDLRNVLREARVASSLCAKR